MTHNSSSATIEASSETIHLHEMKLLLMCLQFYFRTVTSDAVVALLEKTSDWTTLIHTAIDRGVLPLLYQSLREIEPDHIPRSVMLQLQNYYRMNGLHNISQTKELLRVLNLLESGGIAAIAFKGSVLAASAYGNVALRQFNDLDILVHRRQFWNAKALLAAHGYQCRISEPNEKAMFHFTLQIPLVQNDAESTLLNQHFQASALHSNPERNLDLHWGIPPRRRWKKQSFDVLWKDLNTLNLMGQPVQIFSSEATLVVQCINLAKEPNNRSLKQVCDVAQIIRSTPDLNWEAALQLSTKLHTRQLFLIGLNAVHRMLDISLPQFIVDQFDREQDKYDSHRQIQPSNTIDKLWFEYRYQIDTLDQWQDVLFIFSQYLNLALFKVMMTLNERDQEFVSLPSWLSSLYYLLRPIRLLLIYTPIGKRFVKQRC